MWAPVYRLAQLCPSVPPSLLAFQSGQVYLWEPVCRVNEMMGARKAFGTGALSQLDLGQARVILATEHVEE